MRIRGVGDVFDYEYEYEHEHEYEWMQGEDDAERQAVAR